MSSARIPRSMPGHRAPGVGFEAPFDMLRACHERVQRSLALLVRLIEHLDRRGRDDQAVQAARDVLRYFDVAAPHHHEDEERHVFPVLLAGADVDLQSTVRRLQQDHVEMAARWAVAREVLQGLIDAPADGWTGLTADAHAALTRFAQLYDAHIQAEEEVVYPAVEVATDDVALQRMGVEMAARRTGFTPSRPASTGR